MRWATATTLLLLFVVPVAAAEPIVHASASQATARDTANAAGSLVAFLAEDRGSGGTVPPMALDAGRIVVETDVSDPTAHATGIGEVTLVPGVTETSTPHDYGQASLHVGANRANFRTNAYAADPVHPPTVTVTSSCTTFDSSPVQNITRVPLAYQPRPKIHVDAGTALVGAPCGTASLVIHGDILLSLWETDATLNSGQQQVNITTGIQRSTSAPPPAPDARPAVARYVEAYVRATNATLTLPFSTDQQLFVNAVDVSGDYTLEVRAQTGAINAAGQQVDIGGKTTTLRGALDTHFTGAGVRQPFATSVAGTVTAATVDGHPLAVTVAPLGSSPDWTRWVAIEAFLVVAAILAIAATLPPHWFRNARRHGDVPNNYPTSSMRERRAGGYWVKAQEWLDRGWLRRAAWASWRATRLRPDNLQHNLLRVAVLDERGNDRKAVQVLEAMYANARDGRERAIVALEIAASLARLGRQAEAATWLERAGADDPDALVRAESMPYFQALHGTQPARGRSYHSADPSFA